MPWAQIAPGTGQTRKPSFNPTDPNAYPAAAWAPFDGIVQAAKQYGLTAYFDVTGGAPRWAETRAAVKTAARATREQIRGIRFSKGRLYRSATSERQEMPRLTRLTPAAG